MATINTTAETNLITQAQMKKVREVDFVNQFTHTSLEKLIEVLGVTRKIPMRMSIYSKNMEKKSEAEFLRFIQISEAAWPLISMR